MRWAVWLLVILTTTGAFAGEVATVRFGTHEGYGRVVFEFANPMNFTMERTPDTATFHFGDGTAIPTLPGTTRNVSSLTGGDGVAILHVTPGVRIRTMQLDRRVVVDVFDSAQSDAPVVAHPTVAAPKSSHPPRAEPAHNDASTQPAQPMPASSAAPQPAGSKAPDARPIQPPVASPIRAQDGSGASSGSIAQSAPSVPVVQLPTVDAAPAEGSAVTPVPRSPEPVALAATTVEAAADAPANAVLLPFGPDVGAAAFRRGAEAWVVFDEARPLDVSGFQDNPVFAAATVQVLPAGTLLRLPLTAEQNVRLRHQTHGWVVTIASPGAAPVPLAPIIRETRLMFLIAGTGQVVTVADSITGQKLLVGTLRAAGSGVPVGYRIPEVNVLPSWQGVVAEPLSDDIVMRALSDGVAIETGNPLSAPPDSARALADAAVLTRRFDFPPLSVPNLLRRLQGQMADEAAAPSQDRLEPRKAAAETMLALGLGPEAQSLLHLAASEDPRVVDDPGYQGLCGIAALVSGRPDESDGLLVPELSGTDEISLWRAVRAASRQEGSPEAAAIFAATTKLILSYPDALQNRLLPLAAETMATGGATAASDALLAKLPDNPLLAMARAIRAETKGDVSSALTLYDELAAGRDRLVAARSATRATLLRLGNHIIGPAQAADALERGFLDWRGDNREKELRLKVASLRAEAGQWRQAFTLLRESATLFPEDADVIRDRTNTLLAELLRGQGAAAMPALDLVSLVEENAEEAAKAAPDQITSLLADKLSALDLSHRAEPILERMIAASPSGIARATIGSRLATMRLNDGDLAGAADALSTTSVPDLPGPLVEQRGLLDARIHAQAHDVVGASAILSGLDTAPADDLRAAILADAGDWRGSEAALQSLVSRLVPPTGILAPEQQDLLLRLASAEARAGDDAAARELGTREAERMTQPRGDMFRLLTAAPIKTVDDLGRAGREIALARAIPSGLSALGTR